MSACCVALLSQRQKRCDNAFVVLNHETYGLGWRTFRRRMHLNRVQRNMPTRSRATASSDQLAFLFDAPVEREHTLAVAVAAPPKTKRRSKPAAQNASRLPRSHVTSRDACRLTVEQAAELLCVSVKTLEAWRRLGKGPLFVKLGRAVRYEMQALDQFTRSRTVRNSAEGRMLDARR
jgi:hypothetical protein